jgi:hypothetical protein
MHNELWDGVTLKRNHAEFHFQRMWKSLQRPEKYAVYEAAGVDMGFEWELAFYAHLDAFLSATRSIPEILQCCFGVDKRWKEWPNLSPAEQIRRRQFRDEFKAAYEEFRDLDLGEARHISEHRRGYPPVEARVKGFFGVTHVGGPIKKVPRSETRQIDDPQFAWLLKPRAVLPNWRDFTIDGKLLYDECKNYLTRAENLIEQARVVAERVHGNEILTFPL